jgi:uncharacterized protein
MSGHITVFDYVALVLVIIGGINWGLIGLFDFNMVNFIFGAHHMVTNFVYVLVGAAALWTISIVVKTKGK